MPELEDIFNGGDIERSGDTLRIKAFTGEVTKSAAGTALTIANDAVVTAKILNSAVTTAKINDSAVTTAKINDGAVTEAKQTLADNTTNNASTSAHGYVVKATAPASGLLSAVGIGNGETAYSMKPLFDTTAPEALGTAAAGTALVAARRDHVHAMSGAMVTMASDLTGQNLTSVTAVSWDTEQYDVGGWWVIGSPTIFTVPSGVTRVNISAALRLANITADMYVFIAIQKNSSSDYPGVALQATEVGTSPMNLGCASIGVPCVATDTFRLVVVVETDTSVDIIAARSFMSIQAVG